MSAGKDVSSQLPSIARGNPGCAAQRQSVRGCDHHGPPLFSSEVGMSLSGNVTALIVRDVFTGWLDGCPAGSKCTEEVFHALQHFVSPTEKVGMVATDDALEYECACKQLDYRHRTSTPGRPQTNGIAERSVREAIEGARTVMQQAGSPHRWWARALRHY